MSLSSEIKETIKDTGSTYFFLLKIMIPISIIVKILEEYGAIELIGENLTPAMGVVGLPGEFGLVIATAMITNIYGALLVFFALSLQYTYTVLTLRILGAFVFGAILNIIFTNFNLFQNDNVLLWKPEYTDPTLAQWAVGQVVYYIMIFLIILSLMSLMRFLKKAGALERLNNFLKPGLKFLGMSKDAAILPIIGLTLGLAYGGGLIVKEAESKLIPKKDVFLSLSFMGLSHSLIEDTLLTLAIGASIFGILFGRILFTILIMIILVKIIGLLSKKTFQKYFINK